jgi:hypothetical protein
MKMPTGKTIINPSLGSTASVCPKLKPGMGGITALWHGS